MNLYSARSLLSIAPPFTEKVFLAYGSCLAAYLLIFLISHGGRAVSILKISIRQIKAARSLLGWSQDDLAAHSGVSKPTIGRLESYETADAIGGRRETAEKLVAALKSAGIQFIPENGGGAGVRLAKRGKRSK